MGAPHVPPVVVGAQAQRVSWSEARINLAVGVVEGTRGAHWARLDPG